MADNVQPPTQQFNERRTADPNTWTHCCCRTLFWFIFLCHFLGVGAFWVFLLLRSNSTPAHRHTFRPMNWYLPLLAAAAAAGIFSFAWLLLNFFSPPTAFKAAWALCGVLTCVLGFVLLLLVRTTIAVAVAMAAFAAVLCQCIHGLRASRHFAFAIQVLQVRTATPNLDQFLVAPSAKLLNLSILLATLYSCFLLYGLGVYTGFLISGTGGSPVVTITSGFGTDIILIAVLWLSFLWTMEVIRNTLFIAIARKHYELYLLEEPSRHGLPIIDSFMALQQTLRQSMGSVCVASALLPVLEFLRKAVRLAFVGQNLESGCADMLAKWGNRWGLVHIGVYNKSFGQASRDAWQRFRHLEMRLMVDTDLTWCFCFFAGVASGMACALGVTLWSFLVRSHEHREYTLMASVYAFLLGYSLTQIAMVWPQARVSAYYAAFARYPRCAALQDTPLAVRIRQILEMGNRAGQ